MPTSLRTVTRTDFASIALASTLLAMGCAKAQTDAPPTAPAAPPPATEPEPTPAATPEAPEPAAAPACGNAEACLAKAAELEPTDPEAATEALYGACLGGAVKGCEDAGLRWMKKVEATANDPLNARIIDAFERSCALGGGMHGCGNVGLAYFYGTRGLKVDEQKAVEYMTKSCDVDGNKFVCDRLEQYRNGEVELGVLP